MILGNERCDFIFIKRNLPLDNIVDILGTTLGFRQVPPNKAVNRRSKLLKCRRMSPIGAVA